MVFILLLLGGLSVYCLMRSYINKYSWYFCAIICSLIVALYASFLLISASGNYISVGYMLDDFDGRMFLSLIANKISFFTIIRIFNVSSAIFLCSLSLFSRSYFTPRGEASALVRLAKTGLLFSFPILYCIFYDPDFVFALYCRSVENPDGSVYFSACVIDLLFHIISALYMILPLFFLLKKKKQLFTEYKTKQLFGVSLFVMLADVIYVIILRLFSIRRIYFGQTPSQLVAIRTYGAQFRNEYLIYPVIILAAIIVLIITIGRFHLIRQDGIIRRLIFNIQAKRTQKAMTGILHSVKGVIYSYKLTIDDTVEMNPDSSQNKALCELSADMEAYISSIAGMLNSKDIRGDFAAEECYVSDILDEMLDDFKHGDNIRVIKDYATEKEKVYADSYYLKNALLNICNNAADAINQKNEPGEITVSVASEFDLAVIIISDTGTGIPKKELKRIFNQYYTTKSRVKNWGIGLSFTYKIVKKHKGHISVKSKVGKGTAFNIILQRI